MSERRIRRSEFRDVPGSNGRQKWATAVAYNVTDDYGTVWLPGVFDAALSERMPVVLFGHDWYNLDHVLGRGVDFRQTPDDVGPPGVDVLMEFADVEAADLAMKLLDQRVLTDVSVGFERREWLTRDKLPKELLELGATEAMQRAGMDELSLVVRGAVPGAQVRSRRGAVDLDAVVEIAKRKAAGELTDAEASAALDLLAGSPAAATELIESSGPTPEEVAAISEAVAAEAAALEADIDAALESIGRSARR
jgi:hypothetical protein